MGVTSASADIGYETCAKRLTDDQSSLTRSQAVARITDRTAKNCTGHVT